jgi:putative inorganic carbon (hco3(-)) transporter
MRTGAPRSGWRRGILPLAIGLAVSLPFLGGLILAPTEGAVPLLALGVLCGLGVTGSWFAFRRPVIALVTLFVGLAPIDFLLTFGGGTTATRLIALAAVGALAIGLCVRGSSGRVPLSVGAWLVAFAWMTASVMWAGDQPKSIERLAQTGLAILLVTLVALSRLDRSDVRALLVAVVGGALGVAGYMLIAQPHMPSNAHRVYLSNGSEAIDPNGVALALVTPLAIVLAAAVGPGDPRRRIAGALLIPVFTIAILQTESRGALLAVGAMVLWVAIRSRHRLVAGATIALAALLASLQSGVFSRFNDLEGAGRMPIWKVGIAAFREHWLIGNGYGTFTDAFDQVYLTVPHTFITGWSREAHDLPIACFVELGVLGATLVLYAWWCQFRQLSSIPADDRDAWLRLAGEAGILGLFVVALFLDVLVLKPAWVLPVLIAAVATMRGREHAALGLSDQDQAPQGRSFGGALAGTLPT